MFRGTSCSLNPCSVPRKQLTARNPREAAPRVGWGSECRAHSRRPGREHPEEQTALVEQSGLLGRLDAMFQWWNIQAFFAANMRRCDGAGALRPTSDAERLALLPPEVQAYIRHHRL